VSSIFLDSGIDLNYEIIGSESNDKLLLIHGNNESMEFFDNLIDKIENKYQLYLVDMRSHGNSSFGEIHYDLMAYDIYLFIKKFELDDIKILGFSDGAIVSLLLSINFHLDNELILCGLNTKFSDTKRKLYKEMREELKENNSPYISLMCFEPNIKNKLLLTVKNKITLIYGQDDCFKPKRIKKIGRLLKTPIIYIKGANHFNYFNDFDLIKQLLIYI
jgi:pimeloyl-ACP methyl ester carboxylesterase